MEGGPPGFQRDFSCPAVLRYPDHPLGACFAYGALTLSRGPSQAASATCSMQTGRTPSGPYNPGATRTPVWAGPLSLAATQGISVDFYSWGYLDVSVLPVGSPCGVTAHDRCRVAPFGNPGITACVRLPRDYRGLPRPSSPVRAKASTVRPYFAWPDFLRPHSKARLFSSQRTGAHVGNTLGAFLSYYPSPYPYFQTSVASKNPLASHLMYQSCSRLSTARRRPGVTFATPFSRRATSIYGSPGCVKALRERYLATLPVARGDGVCGREARARGGA